MLYRIGLDVGSTTAKMVVVDENMQVVWSRYRRHSAQVKDVLRQFFAEAAQIVGDSKVTIGLTGSVGMQTAEMLQTEFVQEVVAASAYARRVHPEANALIDIGGEDSKVVLLAQGRADLRMNGNCAGGTGAFIDQMAALLGLSHGEMNQMAMKSTQLHTIAARCGVFAKTDVQNLISRNVPTEDICASVFHSIAVQTITTLAHGCHIQPPVLLCGGPLTFLPALRRAFADYMGIDEEMFLVTEDSCLIPAIGTAIQCKAKPLAICQLQQMLEQPVESKMISALKPLFSSRNELMAWRKAKSVATDLAPMRKGHEQIVIGVDSGSTTTKIIAARTNGDIIFSHYAQSLGNPVKTVADGLTRLKTKAAHNGTTLDIVGSCSTGYGEELIKAAFGLDEGIIETMAHYRAARRMAPDVSFILDIGGQDMKAIFVEQGVVTRMELNEACSSGCGTFLHTFAQSLGRSIDDFAQEACMAEHPCDLGTRCTVFMNSKIKQVLREGAEVGDIAAGLSYSVVNNCLYKVLKLKDISELGKHIVVQGGTMRNDAVVRALELLTGCNVMRSSMPEMMGAYGCALYAAEHLSQPKSLEQIMGQTQYDMRPMQCKGCENRCLVTRYRFANGSSYFNGNKCERVFTNNGRNQQHGQNIYSYKYQLLFDRQNIVGQRRIGIPRTLNIYDNYPLWQKLITECGMQVVLSSESQMQRYESALNTVMSDNICFPAKLVHSHLSELMTMDVERIFMPYVVYEQQESATAVNSYNCPIVSGYSDVIRSVMPSDIPVDSPVLNLADHSLMKRQVVDYFNGLGIGKRKAANAFKVAWEEQLKYELMVRKKAEEILKDSRQQGRLTILLAGRPYHTDPLVQHRLGETIAAMGVNVISEDIVRLSPDLDDGETNIVRQWAYMNRIIKAAQWVATSGDDVQFVQMTSFGCGPDAFIQDEVRSLLARHGKIYTMLKIDDMSNVGSLKLRVRSLIESLKQKNGKKDCNVGKPLHKTRPFNSEEQQRTILVPFISEFISPLLPAVGHVAGYNIKVLPPSDADSAALGLQYANNEVCYPATLIVGDIIKALKSGKYDLDKVAVAMTQTGGQCRATNYAGLIRRAMVQAGFSNVPLVTLGVTTAADEGQESMHVKWRKVGPKVVTTLFYADTIAKMYYAAVPREIKPGLAAALRDKFLKRAAESLRQGNVKDLYLHAADAAKEFNLIVRQMDTRRVGIVGEIFLKFNHFAHQHIAERLSEQGIEVVPPLISPFFMQEFVNIVRNHKMHLTKGLMSVTVSKMLYALVKRKIRKFNKVAGSFRYYRPFTDIHDLAHGADGIVSPAAQFGEGWLLPSEVVEMAETGVRDILSLQPFGCIANHVVARGLENAITRRYPNINLLHLDFDSGVSSVNITNRLLLFLAHDEETLA